VRKAPSGAFSVAVKVGNQLDPVVNDVSAGALIASKVEVGMAGEELGTRTDTGRWGYISNAA
jgi:hypothetical protein